MKEVKETGEVVAVCASGKKGTRKRDVGRALLREDWGIEGDAHGGSRRRQVSLLAVESIEKQQAKIAETAGGSNHPVLHPGDFAENLTVRGIDLPVLPVGTKLAVGEEVLLEVTQIGKACHSACEIKKLTGDCIMPREGIFARVLKGGWVKTSDPIVIQKAAGG